MNVKIPKYETLPAFGKILVWSFGIIGWIAALIIGVGLAVNAYPFVGWVGETILQVMVWSLWLAVGIWGGAKSMKAMDASDF